MPEPVSEAQRRYGEAGTRQMRKGGLRRAQQIAKQRVFEYSDVLTCGACGGPRGKSRGWKCSACEEEMAA